jgi:CRP-like cAMP-binding protein
VVKGAGYAYRLHEPILREAISRDGPLYRMLLRYTRTLIMQMTQLAACSTDHPVDKQFCRWLLTSLDQLYEKELVLPEALLADMVGAPSEIVLATVGTLHHRGVIDYSPGHIKMLDRTSLEGQVCQCYQAIKKEFEHLFHELPVMAR